MRPRLSPTYAEAIYEELRKQILAGVLRPGDRMAETDLAQQMGTSQGPVREAFARLREQGLLITLPYRGTYVSEISADEAQDAYAVRAVLERKALQLALPRMGPEQYVALAEDISLMEKAMRSNNIADNIAADMMFHRRVYEWSASPTLLQCWDLVETKIRKFAIVASPPVFRDPLRPVRSHFTLVDYMKKGYSPELEAELDRHLEAIWLTDEQLAASN